MPQESEGPYAWERVAHSAARVPSKRYHTGEQKVEIAHQSDRFCAIYSKPSCHSVTKRDVDKVTKWWSSIPASLAIIPGLKEMFQEAHSLGCIDFKLPPINATSGVVLSRAIDAMECLFRKHYPMIFKVGYTHNCVFRWCNPIWGYVTEKDNKWTNMCVMNLASEPYSVSMLESALIEKFSSTLTDHEMVSFVKWCHSKSFPELVNRDCLESMLLCFWMMIPYDPALR